MHIFRTDFKLMQELCISSVPCVSHPFYMLTHTHTHTFQEYLYRYVALAAGGWAAGPWQRGRSRSTGKTLIISPADAGMSLCVN